MTRWKPKDKKSEWEKKLDILRKEIKQEIQNIKKPKPQEEKYREAYTSPRDDEITEKETEELNKRMRDINRKYQERHDKLTFRDRIKAKQSATTRTSIAEQLSELKEHDEQNKHRKIKPFTIEEGEITYYDAE